MIQKLHLVMPMAGGGTRFVNYGFNMPKPLIKIHDKPFFHWAAQSIINFIEVRDIIFIVLQEHIDKFKIDREILNYYPDAVIHVIPEILNGAVLTCREGAAKINDSYPILFNDCDHAFICKSFCDFCNAGNFNTPDGALLTFLSRSPSYSYVKYDSDFNVKGTAEKQVVSSDAICGAYYFRNKEIFSTLSELYLSKCSYSEFFMSGVFNEMASQNMDIKIFRTDKHISFGTPDEYILAKDDSELKYIGRF